METDPVGRSGDAADDPAILAAPSGPVWILGTDKQFGLLVYDLDGRERHALGTGRLNNVDAVPAADGTFLAAASNRTTPAIDLFVVDPAGDEARLAGRVPLSLDDPYGLCMATVDDRTFVFVGNKDGLVEQWKIDADLQGSLADSFRFDSQTEGCVVDTASGTLYVGEEGTGIWAVDLDDGDMHLIDRTGAGYLTADVEGMDVYAGEEQRYLVVSSQGDDSYVVYSLPEERPLLKFRIADNPELDIDGTSDTDGLAVRAAPLPGYPRGVLVVQDGWNQAVVRNQNFKLVDWRQIEALLPTVP